MNERLNPRGVDLDLRTKEISEQVALGIPGHPTREGWTRCKRKVSCLAAIALKICLDTQISVDVENECRSTTIETMPLATGKIWSVAEVRIVKCRLRPRELLGPCDCTHQDECPHGPVC